MLHENLIRQYFVPEQRSNWRALIPTAPLPSAYRTRRIGKCTGNLLLFTIGETAHGKATNLDRDIRSIIIREGQGIVARPSTSGSLKESKSYVGVDLAGCSPESLRRILEGVVAVVRERAWEWCTRFFVPPFSGESMRTSISAIVRGLGRDYADSLEMLSVDAKKEEAAGLPFVDGERTPINLLVGEDRYSGGLRTTARMPTVWLSPRLVDGGGKRATLAKVLAANGIRKNDSVTLEVQEECIRLWPRESVK